MRGYSRFGGRNGSAVSWLLRSPVHFAARGGIARRNSGERLAGYRTTPMRELQSDAQETAAPDVDISN